MSILGPAASVADDGVLSLDWELPRIVRDEMPDGGIKMYLGDESVPDFLARDFVGPAEEALARSAGIEEIKNNLVAYCKDLRAVTFQMRFQALHNLELASPEVMRLRAFRNEAKMMQGELENEACVHKDEIVAKLQRLAPSERADLLVSTLCALYDGNFFINASRIGLTKDSLQEVVRDFCNNKDNSREIGAERLSSIDAVLITLGCQGHIKEDLSNEIVYKLYSGLLDKWFRKEKVEAVLEVSGIYGVLGSLFGLELVGIKPFIGFFNVLPVAMLYLGIRYFGSRSHVDRVTDRLDYYCCGAMSYEPLRPILGPSWRANLPKITAETSASDTKAISRQKEEAMVPHALRLFGVPEKKILNAAAKGGFDPDSGKKVELRNLLEKERASARWGIKTEEEFKVVYRALLSREELQFFYARLCARRLCKEMIEAA